MRGNHLNRAFRDWHVGLLSNRSLSPAPTFVFMLPVNKDPSVCCNVSLSSVSFSRRFTVWIRAHNRTHSLTHPSYTCIHTINTGSVCLGSMTSCHNTVRQRCGLNQLRWLQRCCKLKSYVFSVGPTDCNHSAFWLINHHWENNVKPCNTSILRRQLLQ